MSKVLIPVSDSPSISIQREDRRYVRSKGECVERLEPAMVGVTSLS